MDTTEHIGEIVSIERNRVRVLIKSASACSSCHMKGACSASDIQDKYIESEVGDDNFDIGEKVLISCSDGQGFYALFWGYILPLILMVIVLFVGNEILKDELEAGLLSIFILPFYYGFLFIRRRYFAKKLKMKIQKLYL